MKLERLILILLSSQFIVACLGDSSSEVVKAQEEEEFKTRPSLLNECVTIGLAGNKELAEYLEVGLEQPGFSEEYDTLGDFFEDKTAEFGGEGLGALANESMLYFRTATHYGILLGYRLASDNNARLNDVKALFKSLTSREITDEEFEELNAMSRDFDNDVDKKAAQFAAIVSSAEVQCL